jgi:hypothetical protein
MSKWGQESSLWDKSSIVWVEDFVKKSLIGYTTVIIRTDSLSQEDKIKYKIVIPTRFSSRRDSNINVIAINTDLNSNIVKTG